MPLIGPLKAVALTGFHALSEADIASRFPGKGIMTCWKVIQNRYADDGIVQALAQLEVTEKPSKALTTTLEAYVCKLNLPYIELTNVTDVGWYLFKNSELNLRV